MLNLSESWNRTRGYILDARSNVSQAAEGVFSDELSDVEEFLDHNELELAADLLETVIEDDIECSNVAREKLALAFLSMGLEQRAQEIDRRLTTARGWNYKSILPEEPE